MTKKICPPFTESILTVLISRTGRGWNSSFTTKCTTTESRSACQAIARCWREISKKFLIFVLISNC